MTEVQSRVQALTGHPETVQALVDDHILAAARGPAALDAALDGRGLNTIRACYRALLDRNWQADAMRAVDARVRARTAAARDEEAAVRRGGDR